MSLEPTIIELSINTIKIVYVLILAILLMPIRLRVSLLMLYKRRIRIIRSTTIRAIRRTTIAIYRVRVLLGY